MEQPYAEARVLNGHRKTIDDPLGLRPPPLKQADRTMDQASNLAAAVRDLHEHLLGPKLTGGSTGPENKMPEGALNLLADRGRYVSDRLCDAIVDLADIAEALGLEETKAQTIVKHEPVA